MAPRVLLASALLALFLSGLATADDIKIETLSKGDCSRKAKKGDSLKMHYEGTLADGSEFDSSYKRGEPFGFTLGEGMVIKGWDLGVEGMCKGEVRQLTVPSDLGYGDSGYPPVIPEKATLHFKVELVEFDDSSEEL